MICLPGLRYFFTFVEDNAILPFSCPIRGQLIAACRFASGGPGATGHRRNAILAVLISAKDHLKGVLSARLAEVIQSIFGL